MFHMEWWLQLNNGGVTFTLNPGTHLRGLGNEFAFPALEGAHLHIEATVTETATGKKESRIDRAAVFAIKKHKVSFERSSEHFKPGLPYVVKVMEWFAEVLVVICCKLSKCFIFKISVAQKQIQMD